MNHEPSSTHETSNASSSLKTKVGLALASIGLIGTAGCSGEAAPAPEHDPSSGTTLKSDSNKEDTPGANETAPVSEYEISWQDHTTFKDVVSAYYDKYVAYQSSAEMYDEPGNPLYLEGLFGADWESNPELVDYVTYIKDGSVTVSTNHFATGENGDTEYEYDITVKKVSDVVENVDTVSGNVLVHGTDNVMDTVLSGFSPDGTSLDSYGNYHLTFTSIDGAWQVTEVDNLDNNPAPLPDYN